MTYHGSCHACHEGFGDHTCEVTLKVYPSYPKEPNVKQPKIIYLACPYADVDPQVLGFRFKRVTEAARLLITIGGYLVFSPITHAHSLQVEKHKGWGFWRNLDLPILQICGLLIIIKLPGWMHSVGVTGEVNAASIWNIPTLYIGNHEISDVAEIVKAWDYLDEFSTKDKYGTKIP